MSRVIIVDNCKECGYYTTEGFCVKHIWQEKMEDDIIPDWCPFSILPDIKEPEFEDYALPRARENISCYVAGWNDCLKKVRGDK